ncbi:hypothetical protein DFH09DRAFT_1334965 [Mycena vulgaris]|nr:hypothetical protein DFH09DRAFT_1334965 [Mycena vulgaris]
MPLALRPSTLRSIRSRHQRCPLLHDIFAHPLLALAALYLPPCPASAYYSRAQRHLRAPLPRCALAAPTLLAVPSSLMPAVDLYSRNRISVLFWDGFGPRSSLDDRYLRPVRANASRQPSAIRGASFDVPPSAWLPSISHVALRARSSLLRTCIKHCYRATSNIVQLIPRSSTTFVFPRVYIPRV